MRAKQLAFDVEQTYVVVFDQGEQVVDGLTEWAARTGIRAARLTGIGGFRRVTLGFFDPEVQDYRHIPLDQQTEVLALIGDFAMAENGRAPQLHATWWSGCRTGRRAAGT
ncbi:PPC domain-containing DNA-binding protein [Nonomuraea sp. NPDC049709]|uniref:PPC domain-containing DNA-binding protein n=1 Tax=Nonomuraea sp. NPDC049709 TaxID=3154736 RepID=UPI00343690A0